MIRRTTIAGLLCLAAAAAAPTAAHAADGWKALGATTAPLATDGERLVVTSPEAGRLLVRDDRTGKTWRLTLPAGCTFSGVIGGGNAAAQCGSVDSGIHSGSLSEPVLLHQPRYTLVNLTTGAVRPVPLFKDPVGNESPTPQLVALGSRWADFTLQGYHSAHREFVRLADGLRQPDSPPMVDAGAYAATAPDLGSPTDRVLQPLCAPLRRPTETTDNGGIVTRPVAAVSRGGAWIAYAQRAGERAEAVAWRCGQRAPVSLASCPDTYLCTPQLGGGLATVSRGGLKVLRLRDRRTFSYRAPEAAWSMPHTLAHTRRYVYLTAQDLSGKTPRNLVFRKAAPAR